jgi:hypothetical protein
MHKTGRFDQPRRSQDVGAVFVLQGASFAANDAPPNRSLTWPSTLKQVLLLLVKLASIKITCLLTEVVSIGCIMSLAAWRVGEGVPKQKLGRLFP